MASKLPKTGDAAIRRRDGEPPRLDDKYFVRTEELVEALAGLPRIDYKKFREDVDAFVDQDPTPRPWPEP
jgi:hypothetical protein